MPCAATADSTRTNIQCPAMADALSPRRCRLLRKTPFSSSRQETPLNGSTLPRCFRHPLLVPCVQRRVIIPHRGSSGNIRPIRRSITRVKPATDCSYTSEDCCASRKLRTLYCAWIHDTTSAVTSSRQIVSLGRGSGNGYGHLGVDPRPVSRSPDSPRGTGSTRGVSRMRRSRHKRAIVPHRREPRPRIGSGRRRPEKIPPLLWVLAQVEQLAPWLAGIKVPFSR